MGLNRRDIETSFVDMGSFPTIGICSEVRKKGKKLELRG